MKDGVAWGELPGISRRHSGLLRVDKNTCFHDEARHSSALFNRVGEMPSPSDHKGHVTFEVDGTFPRDSGTMGKAGGHHRDHLDVDHDAARLPGPDDNMTFGIGVIFVKEPRPPQLRLGGVMEQPKEVAIIKQIVTGGSADREGTLKQGDIIVTVGECARVRGQADTLAASQ